MENQRYLRLVARRPKPKRDVDHSKITTLTC